MPSRSNLISHFGDINVSQRIQNGGNILRYSLLQLIFMKKPGFLFFLFLENGQKSLMD